MLYKTAGHEKFRGVAVGVTGAAVTLDTIQCRNLQMVRVYNIGFKNSNNANSDFTVGVWDNTLFAEYDCIQNLVANRAYRYSGNEIILHPTDILRVVITDSTNGDVLQVWLQYEVLSVMPIEP